MVIDAWLPKISESDCCKVISKKLNSLNFVVVSFQQKCFDEINGYLGDHSVLTVEIERNGVKECFEFFVKCLPHVQSQRTFLLEFNGFFKEKQFFTKYLSTLRAHSIDLLDDAIPACYFVNDELFVFEDLTARGFKTFPSRTPLNVACIKAGLVALAKLHASGLVLEELKSFRLTDDFAEELKESFYLDTESGRRAIKSCKSGMRALIDLTHSEHMAISKELFTEWALEGCDLQKEFSKPSSEYRNTVCHADPWTKNFMFRLDEDQPIKATIVDFQTYRYGPPAQDAMVFIYLVSDRATRKEHMDQLLRFYYAELRTNFDRFGLKDVIGEEEFFASCDYFRRFALTQNILHFQVVILADEIATELFSEPGKAEVVLFDDKYEFFKEVCRRDPLFKQRNFELIEELREFYEKQLLD